MPQYVLPDLPYDFGALQPHLSARILELHHGKHHAAYVAKANETLEQLAAARDKDDWVRTAGLERALAFNVSGHVLHSLFWRNMMPKGGGRPSGELATAIDRDFGGFDKMKRQMKEVAASIMGSGWSALVWEPLSQRLLVTQVYDHQSNMAQAGLPLLVIDAWEHAYYLQYENRKTDFFEAIWNCWNWQDVAERYQAARALEANLQGTATASV